MYPVHKITNKKGFVSVRMIKDHNSYSAGIKYIGGNKNIATAIEISGVDFVSEDIQLKYKSLGTSMKYQCNGVSEDVIFAFQFTVNERNMAIYATQIKWTSRVEKRTIALGKARI